MEKALNQKVTDTGNNTFMVTSDYRRTVNRSINGKTLTCTVSHVSLSSPTSGSVTLTILCEYNSDLTVHWLCNLHNLKVFYRGLCLEIVHDIKC